MNRKIRVFIAEDTRIARDLIVDSIKNFAEKKFGERDYFEIDKAETYQKAHQKIVESAKNKDYYDLMFIDIDFTEDGHGGERDSGYKLIEKAFEVSPLAKISTYSGQFRAADLWPRYEELKNKGLIIHTFDKSHAEAGEPNWMDKGLEQLIDEITEKQILWDIWEAHKLILEEIHDRKYLNDQMENLRLINTVASNLDSALMLLMNLDRLQAREFVFRMVIYLYHNSLEMLCRAGKTDEEIISLSNENKQNAESAISVERTVTLNFPDSVNAQRIFISSIPDERIRFVDTLNYYRNKSIHPTKGFKLTLSNVIFSVLAFVLAITKDKSKIILERTKEFIKTQEDTYEKRKLLEIVDFIEK